ncbi:AraC-type DNA-binding protein [Dyadobacter soli]|uniref:AraC-type DNA-binding protein n=1 Tax=Dyadobacter soli TaxID=659014 RepID=A0A1G8CNE1_9BACT|nr:helix-turn-helix transcriptional regulator [Dyadobacter soli]SDH47051.1 AraC-type DNA-binding protein [Dyadobacter soli]
MQVKALLTSVSDMPAVEKISGPEWSSLTRSDNYHIFWLKHGQGLLSIDLQRHIVSTGMIFCIAPGQVFKLDPTISLGGYHVAFNRSFLGNGRERILRALNELSRSTGPMAACLESSQDAELQETFDMMIAECASRDAYTCEILQGMLLVLVSYLLGCTAAAAPPCVSRESRIVCAFMEQIENNFCSRKRVSDYASELFVSPGYLSEVVRRISGYPASHHIRQRILLEARRHAISTNSSARQVADKLGFADSSTFSKFFKTFSGDNFSRFRATGGEI